MTHLPPTPISKESEPADNFFRRLTAWCARTAEIATRLSLAVVFIWFGALKVAGVSPAEPLVTQTFFFLPAPLVVYGLGGTEILIGLMLLFRRSLKWALGLLALHLPGTFLSFLIAPQRCFSGPFQLTTEGEFIVKNLVILSAAMFLAGSTLQKDKVRV